MLRGGYNTLLLCSSALVGSERHAQGKYSAYVPLPCKAMEAWCGALEKGLSPCSSQLDLPHKVLCLNVSGMSQEEIRFPTALNEAPLV